jgi:hypothetical protein
MDLRGSQKDPLIEKYKDISNHPCVNEIRALFDMGFADLTANVKAIDKFKGNLDLAINYLCALQEEEVKEVEPAMMKGRNAISSKIETP